MSNQTETMSEMELEQLPQGWSATVVWPASAIAGVRYKGKLYAYGETIVGADDVVVKTTDMQYDKYLRAKGLFGTPPSASVTPPEDPQAGYAAKYKVHLTDVLDALENCMDLLDTPIARRKNEGSEIYCETIRHTREQLEKHGRRQKV